MISRIILICVFLVYVSAFHADELNIISKPECQPNKVYQKDDVTCFCNRYGRWPHKNCSLVFEKDAVCKPNSYVQVNCNVCRCSKAGTIEREFCTKHICNANPDNTYRRYGSKGKCEVNHWYVINTCRLCFCITRDNLLCAPETNPKKVQVGKYNLTDCGSEWLNDINRLLASVNPLRQGNKNDKPVNLVNQVNTESVESQVIFETQSTPKIEPPKDNPQTLNYNGEKNGDENIKIARNDDRNDENDLGSTSESNSEEKVEEGKAMAQITGNTIMPYEIYEENDSHNSHEIESDRKESDNELGDSKKEFEEVDVTKEVESAIDINKSERKVQNVMDQESDEPLLKLNLPGMLGKVFNFGIRKSMVSITDTNCEPGTTSTIKCNTCFCLTNGKLLCTKKICE